MGFIGRFVLEWYSRQMGTPNDPHLTDNPTEASYSQNSGLGPKHAHIPR